MAGKALTEPQLTAPAGDWETPAETAPSALRAEEPRLARVVGALGLFLVALVLFTWAFRGGTLLGRIMGPGLSIFFVAAGLGGMLFHAARDPDLQIRRTYGAFGFAWLAAAVLFSVVSYHGQAGGLFLPFGFLCLPLGLLFLLASTRHETSPLWRRAVAGALGVGALVLAGAGLIGANVSAAFLLPYGLLLALAGLAYAWAFISLMGANTEAGYWSGVALGVAGLAVFLVAFCRSALPPLFAAFGWARPAGEPYFATAGFLLMSLGALYFGLAAGLCSDSRLVVLTRRELAAFFYSPIAYVVLFGLTVVGAWLFLEFVQQLESSRGLVEPVIQFYFISYGPVVSVLNIVPVLTMRLLSEEKRTGTLEVLLTAPLGEASVVVSKFLAAWIFYMILWIPVGLFLVALRIEGGQVFDWRPLLSFSIAVGCSGAGFLAMGVFFSSLTRNQIAAAILTFMVMIALFSIFIVNRMIPPGTAWGTFLTHISFIDLWIAAVQGKLIPRDIIFPLSSAVFFLFLSVKVLEARRWS